MKKSGILLGLSVLFMGCNYFTYKDSNHYVIRDPIATLPSGERIIASASVWQNKGQADRIERYALWERNGTTKQLVVLNQESWTITRETQTHVAPDGDHVWLTREGSTVASFDYEKAFAVIGENNQPEWAR